MSLHESLIAPTANAALEQQLRERLSRQLQLGGGFGELEALAVRIGLLQASTTPRFRDPALALFAADHGLAVEGVPPPFGRSSRELALLALQTRLPSTIQARLHGLQLQLVDCGLAEELAPHPRLLLRRIAHGTRNSRLGVAMSGGQVQAALRVGMEMVDAMTGNVLVLAGLGQGSAESAALLLARLSDRPLSTLLPRATPAALRVALEQVLARHAQASEPLELLGALGGYETAVMVGAMLVGASKRSLLIVDGLAACAALRIATVIAPPVTDYVVFCRSSDEPGLDAALADFRARALLDVGLSSSDGLGGAIAWPLIRSAAALLSEAPEVSEPSAG